jgi:hypothetical protein
MSRRFRYGGFTLVEALALIAAIVIVASLLMVFLTGNSHHGGTPQLKDSTQVRGIQQALVFFAQNNADQYPLPSLLDKNNSTIAGDAAAKDTTANIFSFLIYQGSVAPEMFICPAEASGQIRVADKYEFDNPSKAATPASALWDPAFLTDFSNRQVANNSYAHCLPSGTRLEKKWRNTYGASDPIISNRGPEVKAVTYDKNGTPKPTLALGDRSVTFLIHGPRNSWEGNVAFNDNHVEFARTIWGNPESPLTYTARDGTKRGDILFYDEPDDAGGADTINRYLGIFTKAGPTPLDFKAIWD